MTVRNVALTAILLAGLAWSGPGAAQTRLNVQGGWATGGIFTEFEVPFWTETIPEKTGGAVTVRLTNLNEMGLKGPEVFRMMRLGLIDFGTSVLGYVAGDHPENGAPDLAGIANSAAEARAATEAWRPVLEELYTTKYQVTPVIFYPAEAQAVYCNTEIGSLADLQGKKVRVFTRSMADFLEAESRLHDKPFKQVVNEILRRGMAPGSREAERPRFQVVPNRSRLVPGVDPRKLNQLNDQLEADDFVAESGQ